MPQWFFSWTVFPSSVGLSWAYLPRSEASSSRKPPGLGLSAVERYKRERLERKKKEAAMSKKKGLF